MTLYPPDDLNSERYAEQFAAKSKTFHDEDRNAAEACKYDSSKLCHIVEVRPGLFAIFAADFKLLGVTYSWEALHDYYNHRPVYVKKEREKFNIDIDLSSLEINL